jgi:hypothetical protein
MRDSRVAKASWQPSCLHWCRKLFIENGEEINYERPVVIYVINFLLLNIKYRIISYIF